MLADAQDSNADSKKNKKPRRSVQMWRKTIQVSNWAWIGAIVADVGIQAAKTADDPPSRIRMFSGLPSCPLRNTICVWSSLSLRLPQTGSSSTLHWLFSSRSLSAS